MQRNTRKFSFSEFQYKSILVKIPPYKLTRKQPKKKNKTDNKINKTNEKEHHLTHQRLKQNQKQNKLKTNTTPVIVNSLSFVIRSVVLTSLQIFSSVLLNRFASLKFHFPVLFYWCFKFTLSRTRVSCKQSVCVNVCPCVNLYRFVRRFACLIICVDSQVFAFVCVFLGHN